ncbi:hypothetical protein STEG23_014568 [Scotinomys teguina]
MNASSRSATGNVIFLSKQICRVRELRDQDGEETRLWMDQREDVLEVWIQSTDLPLGPADLWVAATAYCGVQTPALFCQSEVTAEVKGALCTSSIDFKLSVYQ